MLVGAAVVLALTDGQWAAVGAVVVASIAAVASIITALISLRAKKSTDEKIGTPNGKGNVVEMLESALRGQALILEGQTGQDNRLASIERRLGAVEERNFCTRFHAGETPVVVQDRN